MERSVVMKKVLILFVFIFLLTACTNKKVQKKEIGTKKMLTCYEENVTYYYYFENDVDNYYMAKYLMEYEFKTNKEAVDYYNILYNEWEKKYTNSNMILDLKIEENVLKVSVMAYNDTDLDSYKNFFKDRYNLNLQDINKTFNDKCLIKPI